MFPYDLALSTTYHKVIGLTTPNAIPDASCGHLEFHMFCVCVTRTRDPEDMRILLPKDAGLAKRCLDALESKEPNAKAAAWQMLAVHPETRQKDWASYAATLAEVERVQAERERAHSGKAPVQQRRPRAKPAAPGARAGGEAGKKQAPQPEQQQISHHQSQQRSTRNQNRTQNQSQEASRLEERNARETEDTHTTHKHKHTHEERCTEPGFLRCTETRLGYCTGSCSRY